MAQTTSRASCKKGILTAALCILGGCGGPILAFMLLIPKIMDDSRDEDHANPRLVLVTPAAGPKSGHVLLLMEWMPDYILVSPAPLRAASKVELDTAADDNLVQQGVQFRLAGVAEVKALQLPYQRSYKTQTGSESLVVEASSGVIKIHKVNEFEDVSCAYTLTSTGPNYQYTHVFWEKPYSD